MSLRPSNICVIMLALAGAISGCGVINNELRSPGGEFGSIANNWIPSPNKRLEVYRAVVALTFFSAVGAKEVSDANTASALYYAMQATVDDINNLAGHVYSQPTLYKQQTIQKGVAQPPYSTCYSLAETCATNPSYNFVEQFEQELPALENHMFKVAAAAVPADDVRKSVKDLALGNWLAAIKDILGVAGELAEIAHNLAASSRSEREAFASLVVAANANNSTSTYISSQCDSPFRQRDPESCRVLNSSTNLAIQTILNYENVRGTASSAGYQTFDVPATAYAPFFALMRASCQSLKGLLPSPPTGHLGSVGPTLTKDKIDCIVFDFTPFVYREDYMIPVEATVQPNP